VQRVDWQVKWAIVRSSGLLLFFDDSSASSPPCVRIDMTFVQFHTVVCDAAKHPSLWAQSAAGDCVFIRPPVGPELFFTVNDESSSGHSAKSWIEAFHQCALSFRIQKAIKDEAVASIARVRAFQDGLLGQKSPGDSMDIPVRDALPVLVNTIACARDEAIAAHHELSSTRAELAVTKHALESSAQELHLLRQLLQQREDELRISATALNEAVVMKEAAVSNASQDRKKIEEKSLQSGSNRSSPVVRPSPASRTHEATLLKDFMEEQSDCDETLVALSPHLTCSSDLLTAGGSVIPSVQDVRAFFSADGRTPCF
jgi:hypothetical protein